MSTVFDMTNNACCTVSGLHSPHPQGAHDHNQHALCCMRESGGPDPSNTFQLRQTRTQTEEFTGIRSVTIVMMNNVRRLSLCWLCAPSPRFSPLTWVLGFLIHLLLSSLLLLLLRLECHRIQISLLEF